MNSDFPMTSIWRGNWGTGGTPHGGTYTYVISNHSYGYLQSDAITVSSNTQYDLYAWLRGELDVDDNGHCWQVRAMWYNASDTYLSYTDVDSGCGGSLTTTWEQQGGRVTAPANAAYLRIQLRVQLLSGWVAFDDVTLAGQVMATKYYYAGRERVAMRQGVGTGTTGLLWLLADHLGSTNKVANADGSFHSSQHYKAWGEVRHTNGTLPTDYMLRLRSAQAYTGQYSHVGDFDLMFYVARWYDPALGRFAQADTIVPGAGNPLAWDRYAYSLNNPVRFVDPSGHRTCTAAQAATGDETCNQNIKQDEGSTPIRHTILLGSVPTVQPIPVSYGTQAEDSWCQGGSCPDYNPGTWTSPAVYVPNAFGLANDVLTWYRNVTYPSETDTIFVYLNYDEYSNGAVGVDSLFISNQSNVDVGVVAVDFGVDLRYDPCGGGTCVYPSVTDYAANPTRITTPNSGLGVVPANSAGVISLVPSGNPHNSQNIFPYAYSVTINVRLAYNTPGFGNGSQWPTVRYQIR